MGTWQVKFLASRWWVGTEHRSSNNYTWFNAHSYDHTPHPKGKGRITYSPHHHLFFFGVGGGMYELLQVQRQICLPSTMVISKCIKCDKWPSASTTITHKLHWAFFLASAVFLFAALTLTYFFSFCFSDDVFLGSSLSAHTSRVIHTE